MSVSGRTMAARWESQATERIAFARCSWCGWSIVTDAVETADRASRVHGLCCAWMRHGSRQHQHQQERAV